MNAVHIFQSNTRQAFYARNKKMMIMFSYILNFYVIMYFNVEKEKVYCITTCTYIHPVTTLYLLCWFVLQAVFVLKKFQ